MLKSDFGAGQRPNVPASLVNVVASTPSVDAASGNVSGDNTYAQVVDKHGDAIGGSNAPTFGLGWQPNPTINQFDIVDGRPPRTTDEIVIDKHTAEEGNLSVGDRVTVLTAQAPRKYDIVGIATFGNANSLAGASITLFTMTEAQRIGNSVGQFAEISVVAKDGVSQDDVVRDIRAQLDQEGLGKKYEVLTGEQITKENQDQIKKQLSFFSIGLTAFALIALIVGAFIIYNTFSIVVAQRLREMALLRAIGASRRQVLTSVIGEAAVVGVVASAVGVGVGVGLAFGLKALMAAAGFELPGSGVEVPFAGLVFALIIGTVVTLVSAIVPARQAARIPPIAAMRAVALERPLNRGLRSGIGLAITLLGVLALLAGLFADSGIVFVAIGALLILLGVFVLSPLFARGLALAIGAPLRRIKGVTGNLARENAARNPRRTATTGAAVMIAVSLVGFITIFAASAERVDQRRDRQPAQDRLHHHRTGREQRTAQRGEPLVGRGDQAAARDRIRGARAPRADRHQRQPHVRERGRCRHRRPAPRFRRGAGQLQGHRRRRDRNLHPEGRRQRLEDRLGDPGDLRQDRREAARGAVHLRREHLR